MALPIFHQPRPRSTLELDENGEVASYEEYFRLRRAAPSSQRPDQVAVSGKIFRYCGKERDNFTDPSIITARATTLHGSAAGSGADPLGTADGLNLYCYAGDNPVSIRSPDGTTRSRSTRAASAAAAMGAPQPTFRRR